MHPLEQLRYLARGWETGDELPAQEAAAVLADLAGQNPGALVQACRRLVERFPGSGAAWWLAARALTAASAEDGAWEAADDLGADPTPELAARAMPTGSTVCAVQPPRELATHLRARTDLRVQKKPRGADVVVVVAGAARHTPQRFFGGPPTAAGSLLLGARAAAVAGSAGAAELWVMVPRGALLPAPLWDQLVARCKVDVQDLWQADRFGAAIGEDGPGTPQAVLAGPTCPAAAELLGWEI